MNDYLRARIGHDIGDVADMLFERLASGMSELTRPKTIPPRDFGTANNRPEMDK